jgi:hypothetical protein
MRSPELHWENVMCSNCVSMDWACPDCRKAYHRGYYKANADKMKARSRKFGAKRRVENQTLVNSFKDVPCADCGVKYPSYVMDFDHVRGEKEFAVGKGVADGYLQSKLINEIQKCEVVCSNCHRIRTHTRKLLVNKRK